MSLIDATQRFQDKTAIDNIIKLDEAIFALLALPLEVLQRIEVIDTQHNELISGPEALVRTTRRLLDLNHHLFNYETVEEFRRDIMENGRVKP